MSEMKHPKLPQHQHKEPTPERTATAPYNFVPLPELVVRAVETPEDLPDHDRYSPELHSGYFDVLLTTRSPLYIRAPYTIEEYLRQEAGENTDFFRQKVKNKPDFFYTVDSCRPVIPGSSLRGMLRNLLEIVSYGKVSWVSDEKLFFRTVDSTAVGKHYNSRMVGGSPGPDSGYGVKVEGGFFRKLGGKHTIEKCVVARVEMKDVVSAFDRDNENELYDGVSGGRPGPNSTPSWRYQHQRIWVKVEPGERAHKHSQAHLRYLKVTSIKSAPAPDHEEGVLVLTGHAPSKHMAFVFIRPNQETIEVPQSLVDRFNDEDQLTQWQARAFPKAQPREGNRPADGHLRDDEPIFFLREHGKLTFLGRAQMFRLPYRNSPIDLVPEHLRKPEDIDYAEAIFGFVRTKKDLEALKEKDLPIPGQGSKGRAYAGRVFVSDAVLEAEQKDIWLSAAGVAAETGATADHQDGEDPKPLVPKILATPKPTAFQQYLVQTTDLKRELKHYGDKVAETAIRGHKLYWHRGKSPRRVLEATQASDKSTQHTQIRPVKDGVKFRFRIHFENLSERELGAACWVLHPAGNPNLKYCHSLGMGKPLGMGAVELKATLHVTDRASRYENLFDGDDWNQGISAPESLSDRPVLDCRIRAFEQHILSEIGAQKARLSEIRRIEALLKILEWPGPDRGRSECATT